VSTIGPQGSEPNDESDITFSITHSPVKLHRVPPNSPIGDGRVRSYTGDESSLHNSNNDLTATDPSIIVPTELQPGTFKELKKSDLGEASLEITGRQGKLYVMLSKRLYANSS
jgi:hypothetical protein